MLTKFKMFAVVAVAAMALTGCAKEESSLSIDDLPGRAKVKGVVCYSDLERYDAREGKLEQIYVTKVEVKVLAKIRNSSISNGQGHGYTIFETVTDAEGRYEFEIPVPEDGGVTVELEALPFEGTREVFDEYDYYGDPIYNRMEGVYGFATGTVRLEPNDIKDKLLRYSFTANDEI